MIITTIMFIQTMINSSVGNLQPNPNPPKWSHGAKGRIHFSRILEVRIRPASGHQTWLGFSRWFHFWIIRIRMGSWLFCNLTWQWKFIGISVLEKLNEHLCDCPLPCLILEDPVAKWLDFCAFLVLSSRLDRDMFILWPAAKASKQTISSTTLERMYQSYIPLKIYGFVSK